MPILIACGTGSFSIDKDDRPSITLVGNSHFSIASHNQEQSKKNSNVAYLIKGDSISYTINVDNNYYLSGTDYRSESIVFLGDNQYYLTLTNIKYSIRVTLYIEEIEKQDSSQHPDSSDGGDQSSGGDHSSSEIIPPQVKNQITYDANGGEYILVDGQKSNKTIYSTIHHPRPNTSIGTDIMKRDGYVLYGWNTKDDLSGEHIGLGSRYLDLEQDSFTLYAEWAPYTAADSFVASLVDKPHAHVEIKGYSGNHTTIVVPEFINNYPVEKISANSFNGINAETIILPKTIYTIEENAFVNCAFKEIYFYDNLLNVCDGSFANCQKLATLHINAILPPRYVATDRHSSFADKIDNIIINENKKKIIIGGGSGAFYSVDACLLKEIYPDYEPFNVAINGWFNNFVQLDIINKYLHKGDIFLHYVESCGSYQLLARNDMGNYDEVTGYDCRFMNCLELNYDLLALSDIRKSTHVFDVFAAFNKARQAQKPQKYTDYTNYADERGDYSSDPELRIKPVTHQVIDEETGEVIKEAALSEEGEISNDCYSEDGNAELRSYYYDFSKKGAKIMFAFAYVNGGSLTSQDTDTINLLDFHSNMTSAFGDCAIYLNTIYEAILDYSCFSDTDWHLDYENALKYTALLAERMGALD